MIDEFEVEPDKEISDLLSEKELNNSKLEKFNDWDVVYNFESEQVIAKRNKQLLIIPITDLKYANTTLHENYWKYRMKNIREKYNEKL